MSRALSVAIVGQGYVGLPLGIAAARAGHRVTGIDLDEGRVADLNAGRSPVGDVADHEVAALVAAGTFRATVDFDAVAGVDVVVICVPTPYKDEAPDLSHVRRAAAEVAPHLTSGTVVILESTTYPGTTEEVLQPILEDGSSLKAGVDFELVFSPERIDPGNERFGIRNTPKIVGGLTPEATRRAQEFYGGFVDTVVPVSGARAAEMAKLLENTFRHINIALVNELAILCHELEVDVWEVIQAASSKPFGFMAFWPGLGVGGHCIPVDPMYLSWRVKQFGGSAKFIDLARDVNNAMPLYCVSRVQEMLNERERSVKGSRILVLGVAYKPEIADMREAPSLALLEALRAKGAFVEFHDPYVSSVRLEDGEVLKGVDLTAERVSGADCVVVATGHRAVDYELVVRHGRLVFDTRNVLDVESPNVQRL